MALTATDKKEIERIARKEIKSFFDSTQAEKKVIDVVEKELGKKTGKLGRAEHKRIVDVATKVIVELYKTLWMRKGFWENALKNTK